MAERGAPGLREVILIAVVVVIAVLASASIIDNVPPLRDLFGQFPVTIVVLVIGTIAMLVLIAKPRSRV